MNNSREGRIAGRVAVVTGGAQGIGFGIASRLAEEGADIVIADIKRDASKTAAEQIASSGGKAKALHVDIGDDTYQLPSWPGMLKPFMAAARFWSTTPRSPIPRVQ